MTAWCQQLAADAAHHDKPLLLINTHFDKSLIYLSSKEQLLLSDAHTAPDDMLHLALVYIMLLSDEVLYDHLYNLGVPSNAQF